MKFGSKNRGPKNFQQKQLPLFIPKNLQTEYPKNNKKLNSLYFSYFYPIVVVVFVSMSNIAFQSNENIFGMAIKLCIWVNYKYFTIP